MKRLLLILALTGCADPEIVYRPVEVAVPKLVMCKFDTIQTPKFATIGLAKDATTFERARAALAELEQRKAYEGQLIAANKACR